jgi:hypothetical protein
MALFSRMVISRPSPRRCRSLKAAKARMTEVMPTPSVQPVRIPTYRLVRLRIPPSTMPVTMDRSVSWGMSPRKTFLSHQSSFFSSGQVRISSGVRCGMATGPPPRERLGL